MYLKQCGWIQLAFNSLMGFCSNQRGRGATGSGSVTAGGQETRHLSVGPPLSPACSSTSDCKSLQVGLPPPGHSFLVVAFHMEDYMSILITWLRVSFQESLGRSSLTGCCGSGSCAWFAGQHPIRAEHAVDGQLRRHHQSRRLPQSFKATQVFCHVFQVYIAWLNMFTV